LRRPSVCMLHRNTASAHNRLAVRNMQAGRDTAVLSITGF